MTAHFNMVKCSVFFLIFACWSLLASAEYRINRIYIDRLDVFDTASGDWFFAASFANSLHFLTREYVIRDELLFGEGDVVDESTLLETEKNLRAMNLFTRVDILLDSLDPLNYNVIVQTKDRWSTNPALLFGSGGDAYRIGSRIEELNLLGTGTVVVPEILYRSENGTKLQARFKIFQRRFFRFPLSLQYDFFINRFRTLHTLDFYKPFYSRSSRNSYGFEIVNNFGNELLFTAGDGYQKMSFFEKGAKLWYSHAWFKEDRLFISGFVDIRKVNRGEVSYRRAFDNSGRVFLAFSSISEDFNKMDKLNTFLVEDVVTGGWGTAILGKTFALDSTGTDAFYLAGVGEKSYLTRNKDAYFFARLVGASAFANSIGFNTYQEFLGLMFYRINPLILFSTLIRQQTVWNWRGIRQLLLDNNHYLRGYTLNDLAGDNRLVTNLEFRFFPDWKLWIFYFSGAIFYDGGVVWKQNTQLAKARWHNALGFGVRIHNDKTAGKLGIVRVDFAYNFDKKRFAEIIVSSDQFFSIFKSHRFELPSIFGEEFEYE